MADKVPDKGDGPLQSGGSRCFKEPSSADYKSSSEFKARVIPYEGCESADSPLVAFSGNNVSIIFNIPRENFRKLAAAVLEHMDNPVQLEASSSFGLSNASKNGSSSNVTKDCNSNNIKNSADNTTEILDAYKGSDFYVSEKLPNIVQAEIHVASEDDGEKNSSNVSGSFGNETEKSVEIIDSPGTSNELSNAHSKSTPNQGNNNVASKENKDSMRDVHLIESKCSKDSIEVDESLSERSNELECSETNRTGDIKEHEADISKHGVNITSSENITGDAQNKYLDKSFDIESIDESISDIDNIGANLSAHALDVSFGSCPELESAWPDIHPFTETEIIPHTEIKSCESAIVRTKYFKLELPHELIVLRITLEEDNLSVEAARYKETSLAEISKDCSEQIKQFPGESRDVISISSEEENSMDKSLSKTCENLDPSSSEDKIETQDHETIPQIEDEVNIKPEESVKEHTKTSKAVASVESCSSHSKHFESPLKQKTRYLTESVKAVPEVEHLERPEVEVLKMGLAEISTTESEGGEISERVASTEETEKVRTTEFVDLLENTHSENFSPETTCISKDESLILPESKMTEKASKQSVESDAAISLSEDLSPDTVTLPMDSVTVSPIKHSPIFLDRENMESNAATLEYECKMEIPDDTEKENSAYVCMSTPRTTPRKNSCENDLLKVANEDHSKTKSSSFKCINVHQTVKDAKDPGAAPRADIAAREESGHLYEKDENGNLLESQSPNMTENQTEINVRDLTDNSHLDDKENGSVQIQSEKNFSVVSEGEAIQKIERERTKLPAEDAENDLTNDLVQDLENVAIGDVSEREKAEHISVRRKFSEISLSEAAEQMSDEDEKGFSSANSEATSLEPAFVNETEKEGDADDKNISVFESVESKNAAECTTEKLPYEDEDNVQSASADDLKNESAAKTSLEEEETETVENVSAECLEDIVEEVENESLKNASENGISQKSILKKGENELHKTFISGECDVKDANENMNGTEKEVSVAKSDDHFVKNRKSESDSLTGTVSSDISDKTPSQKSCSESFDNAENTKDVKNVVPAETPGNENKSPDLVVENGSDGPLDNGHSTDSESRKTTSDEPVELKDGDRESPAEIKEELVSQATECAGDEKAAETGAESTLEGDVLDSDDSKSVASESDDSRGSEERASKRRAKIARNDEVDCAPTRVRTRKAPSNLSQDAIPENSTVTRSSKSSKVFVSNTASKSAGKVSPNPRTLRSKSLDPSPQSDRVAMRDKKYGSLAEAEEAGRKKRASTPDIIKKEVKMAVRSSPRKVTRANTNPESSAASKVQSTRGGVADSQVKARSNMETSLPLRRTKRAQ